MGVYHCHLSRDTDEVYKGGNGEEEDLQYGSAGGGGNPTYRINIEAKGVLLSLSQEDN